MNNKLKQLNKKIIKCRKCPRLINFIKKISTVKRKQNINETYWGKPVPGFGKINSKLLILGLAPAAHGGTRTGRPFTGDKSSDFLFSCLKKANISNLPYSENLNDGLELKSTFITNILKCVPPGDKPTIGELSNCSNHFQNEIETLSKIQTIVALGKVAFDNCIKIYKSRYDLNSKFLFIHGKEYLLPDNKILIACYHPSPRNINTKVVTKKMICNLFLKAKKIAKF